ncbi:hypothetical protein BDN72DRAFT_831222 [Pluteus cervinus]|uniref:Uncharacterized protein n=1 Tax=Pluteus cervinus TaxID=181527 RepID=A0ACD3BCQ6_9AGAR|nr:hypothetical protein BDN72DRAFT_831222 [Pluteus cervinus]
MSIFVRPDSPPPRAPTPEFVPTPLPSPYVRARVRTSSQQQPSTFPGPSRSPIHPPGLSVPPSSKRLLVARSCDHIGDKARSSSLDPESNGVPRRTRSNLRLSTTTTRSLGTPSPPPQEYARDHRRVVSSMPSRHSPPPVPPIPGFSSDIKFIAQPRPSQASSIRFPELDASSIHSDSSLMSSRKQCRSPPAPMEKQRSLGMTCLRFFSLRGSNQKSL